MSMTTYPRLGETLYKKQLSNGLTLMVDKRAGFTRKLAYFVTDFGAIHTEFELEGRKISVPAGIAHFLEHKMFDLPGDRDVSAELAALGAGTNAFTSYDVTAYYISCTENFEKALKLLIEFVSTPYFTPESVQKEMGIIDQEIGMCDDSADNRLFDVMMEDMYREHPVRIPILGNSETIRRITPELLYDCHRAFYTPGNMVLCVIGDVDPEQVRDIALEMLGPEPRPVGEKIRSWNEDMTPASSGREMEMEVSMPMFQIGFKAEPVGEGEEAVRQEIIADLAAEALFGESSALYLKLYEEGIIDSSFGGGFENLDGMAMLFCSGDSYEADTIREELLAQAEKLSQEGIPEEDFLRMKRSAFGRRIRDLDSYSANCYRLSANYFTDFDYLDFPRLYSTVSSGDVLEFLRRVVRSDRCVRGIVNPNKEAD